MSFKSVFDSLIFSFWLAYNEYAKTFDFMIPWFSSWAQMGIDSFSAYVCLKERGFWQVEWRC